MLEQEVECLSKTVYGSIGSALMLYKNSPDSYNNYAGYLHFTPSDGNIVVIPFEMSKSLSGRKIISATLEYYTYWSSDMIIELYSGKSWPLSYNELKTKCTKHSWSGNTTQITHENGAQRWAKVNLTSYASGLEKAFASGDYIFIVLIPDGTEQLIINSSYPASLTVNCENLDPKVYDLSPNDKAYINRSFAMSWYIDADEAHQTSYELGWSSDGGNTWNSLSEESKAYNYDSIFFVAYTFPEGTIDWRVRITTNEGKTSEYAYASFECVKQIPKVSIIAPDNGIGVNNDVSCTVSWEYFGEDLEQEGYEIGWMTKDSSWETVNVVSSDKNHVFPAGTFPVGNVVWRVRVSNGYYFSEYADADFVYVAATPKISVDFPNQIKIPSSVRQIFTWIYSGNDLPQISYEIGWSSDDGNNWNDVFGTGDVAHHIFDAETFPVGNIKWRIRAENSEGYFSEYAYGAFECVGKGNAPVIESITQSAIPSIAWSAEHQAAYEVQIKKDDAVIYSSGMIGGEDRKSVV